jgi:hypothetical protein
MADSLLPMVYGLEILQIELGEEYNECHNMLVKLFAISQNLVARLTLMHIVTYR